MKSADRPERSVFAQRVERIIAAIEPGRVMTYGEVAERAGRRGAARAVVAILRVRDSDLPWHRVVGSGPRISLQGAAGADQARRLRAEGVNLPRKKPPKK